AGSLTASLLTCALDLLAQMILAERPEDYLLADDIRGRSGDLQPVGKLVSLTERGFDLGIAHTLAQLGFISPEFQRDLHRAFAVRPASAAQELAVELAVFLRYQFAECHRDHMRFMGFRPQNGELLEHEAEVRV